jgi:hypothetical protein
MASNSKAGPGDAMTFVRLEAGINGELPDSVRLFHWGWNDFSGVRTFMSEALARLGIARRGTRLVSFDLEHRPGPSYGYGKLAMGSDGLYVNQIRWTARGISTLNEGDAIYVSPTFYADQMQRFHSLVNVALTATPATVFARQLVAASLMEGMPMTPEEFIAWCRTTFNVPEPAALEEVAKSVELALADAASKDPADPPAVPTAPPANAAGAMPPAAPPAYAVPGAGGMVLASLHSMFGTKTDAALEAAARGALASVSANVTAAERLTRLEMSQANSERERIIRSHPTKFTPELTKWAMSQTPEALEAFAKHAPAVATAATQPTSAPIGTANTNRTARVTNYAARYGVTPEQLKKHGGI